MPMQSVRPDIHRGWRTELLAWNGDPDTVDALILRLDQIAAGHGVSLERYRQPYDPDADHTVRREAAAVPDLTDLRQQLARNRRGDTDRPEEDR